MWWQLLSTLFFGALESPESIVADVHRSGPLHSMREVFQEETRLDAYSLEWEYFMIHSDCFHGVVLFTIANPRASVDPITRLPYVFGTFATLTGVWPDGRVTTHTMRDENAFLGTETTRAISVRHQVHMEFATEEEGVLLLRSTSPELLMNLTIARAWGDVLDEVSTRHPLAFGPVSSRQPNGIVNGEDWTLNIAWPRTRVHGIIGACTIRDDGYGYRGNSFGHWMYSASGWHWGACSGHDTHGGRLTWTWTAYHTGDLQVMTLLYKNLDGVYDYRQFRYAQMGWQHTEWAPQADATFPRCVPTVTEVVAEDEHVRVRVRIHTGTNRTFLDFHRALDPTRLESATPYRILEHYGTFEVSVYDAESDALLSHAPALRGGGEVVFPPQSLGWAEAPLWGDGTSSCTTRYYGILAGPPFFKPLPSVQFSR